MLSVGKPVDAYMAARSLSLAVDLYSEAIARGEILGAVLLVARRGKVVLHEAIGVRDRKNNLPMETETPFQIQSMTKPLIASAAVSQEVRETVVTRGITSVSSKSASLSVRPSLLFR
jgi:CubicO group peptidase (beta-lactamase class C family)